MDGSNCSLTCDRVAARNGKYAFHKSFDMIKAKHSVLRYQIPRNLQIFGEWLYAKHSIHYMNLGDYFQVFAVYNMKAQVWLSWDDVQKSAESLGLTTVPVVHHCEFRNEQELQSELTKIAGDVISDGHEGIVARNEDSFPNSRFQENVAKYVREGHIQTDTHWMSQPIIKNKVKRTPVE